MLRELHEKGLDHKVAHSKLSWGRFVVDSTSKAAPKEAIPEIILAAQPELKMAHVGPIVDEEKLDAIVVEEPTTIEVNSLEAAEVPEVEPVVMASEVILEAVVEKTQPEVDVVAPPVEVVSKKTKGKKTV